MARVIFALAIWASTIAAQVLPLAGEWHIRLDTDGSGHQSEWQRQVFDADVMFLPGTTDQAGYGLKTAGPGRGWLSRPYFYSGPAWYQRDIVIPANWRAKRVTLSLERPHWQTEVWLDDRPFGTQNSLATPHVYDLSAAATPGRHRLTICIDNSYKVNVGRDAHSVSDHTQTNWNGIVGRIELRAQDPVWIGDVRITPVLAEKSIRVNAVLHNSTGSPVNAELSASVPGAGPAAVTTKSHVESSQSEIAFTVPLNAGARLWDEYEGAVYRLQLDLASGTYRDQYDAAFGLRDIGTRNKQFVLNGRPIFLRGTLECNIFPLTGYPPMTDDSWDRLFRIARSYGLNHLRFHSWCPPEAAFRAADRAGLLLHVELPVWSHAVGQDRELDEFMAAEARRIISVYGNHPSFTMLCLGNELSGDWAFMDKMVGELKQLDPRRLYTFSSDYVRKSPGATSDYYVTHNTELGPVRIHGSRFTTTTSGTDYDFSKHVERIAVPLVAHELGQWVTYPSYEEIGSYTGVLKPRNLEAFRAQLESRGMGGQAKDFQQASGRFAWLAYKEDIETAIRTPHMGGVQLLQLQDFPGQGEALIGLLDSFWNSKGLFTPEEVRGFFNETVPLLRFSKFVWTNSEVFTGAAEVAHYGKQPLPAAAEWTARDARGTLIGSGKLNVISVTPGQVAKLGDINIQLDRIVRATRVRLALNVSGFENSWDVWVYPKTTPAPPPNSVLIVHAFDEQARSKLAGGGSVLLLLPKNMQNQHTMEMAFLPVFWSLSWFKNQPGTMGVLCDPSHPALADFPTDRHSNWQWWELTEKAPVFILDDTSPSFQPIIQVIDDYHRNHKLGAVFEARIGPGKIVVSSLDLDSALDQRPVARQLRSSLLQYMSTAQFAPTGALDASFLAELVEAK